MGCLDTCRLQTQNKACDCSEDIFDSSAGLSDSIIALVEDDETEGRRMLRSRVYQQHQR